MRQLLCSFLLLVLGSSVALAQTPSVATQAACFIDYVKFCNGTPLSNVRSCFTKNILQLTNTCVSSLINDGFTTREEIATLKEVVVANTGTPSVSQRKTVTERISGAASAVVRKATETVKKITTKRKTETVKASLTKPKVLRSTRNYRRPGPRPFTDQRANDSFCRDMINEWPGCYTRY